jgi:hypothetical protein
MANGHPILEMAGHTLPDPLSNGQNCIWCLNVRFFPFREVTPTIPVTPTTRAFLRLSLITMEFLRTQNIDQKTRNLRTHVAWLNIRFDAVQPKSIERILKHDLKCFSHVSLSGNLFAYPIS